MLEMIRKVVISKMTNKRELMLKYNHQICPNIMKKLEKIKEVSRNCLATWAGGSMYEVEHGPNQFVVDLDKHECNYFRWQLIGIPYTHLIQCIYFLKKR